MNESKIKDTTAFLIIFTALCFDGGQAILGWVPIVGNILADFLSIFAFFTFSLWFYMYGIEMLTPKRLMSMIGGGVIEMIPYLNLLPAWTMVVVYLIGTTKIQELANKHPTLAKGAIIAGSTIKKINNRIPNTPFIDKE